MRINIKEVAFSKIFKITGSFFLILLMLIGFVSSASAVIYGNDDREDIYNLPIDLQDWSVIAMGSTAALMRPSDVTIDHSGEVQFNSPTLQTYHNLCDGERFLDQPAAVAFCSGTLIGDDLFLTAGQCIETEADCANTLFVFNYRMADADNLEPITADDVFSCQEIVVSTYTSESVDYAIVRLERSATPRFTPAIVKTDASPVPVDTPLVMVGYPSGLPTKIDDGGHVRYNHEDDLDYFVATTDSFQGNSGSGVYDWDSKELVGILVRGETDYVQKDNCYVPNVCEETGCRGEDSTYAFNAIQALCLTLPGSQPCADPYCGDGRCDPDESLLTCPEDCTPCGNGICAPDENPLTCPDDCDPEMFNITGRVTGVLQAGVIVSLYNAEGLPVATATTDPNGDYAFPDLDNGTYSIAPFDSDAFFVPQSYNNIEIPLSQSISFDFAAFSCAGAIAISPAGIQEISGNTTLSENDAVPGCSIGSTAPDDLYVFTLGSPTDVNAVVTGFDTVLYMRQACYAPESELACNDDATPPGDFGSALSVRLIAGNIS